PFPKSFSIDKESAPGKLRFTGGKSAVRSPAFRRNRLVSRNGSVAGARGLKAGLRADFHGRIEMRKQLLAMIAAITIPALALAQAPDAKAKAEQILKQARAAIGDEKKLKELQGLSITGTARQGAGDRQMESDLEIEVLMPDKVKKTTTNQFITMINALNGDQFWNDFIPGMGGGGGGFGERRVGGPGGAGAPGGPGGPGGMFGPNSPMGSYIQLQQRREM